MEPQLTAPARAAFEAARDHVVSHGHEAVHGAHIVLGVLGLEEGTACDTLNRMGVDRAAARAGLLAVLPPSRERGRDGEYPYDASGVAVLEAMTAEATRRRSDRITSALVLSAILEAEGPEVRALRAAGVPIPDLAAELRSSLDELE